jgi:Flp pilus assembly pilin Flp
MNRKSASAPAIPPETISLLDKVVYSYLTPATKLIVMEPNEGRELVEYALIAVLVALGVTLMLSGVGDQIVNIWNAVAGFVLK